MQLRNNNEVKDITLNLQDAYLDRGHTFLDPAIQTNGILKILKKAKIIKYIVSTINYNYNLVPVAFLNIGILRKYDYEGVMQYINSFSKEDFK